MIVKTARIYDRLIKGKYRERVYRETWWLMGVVPLYMRETIVGSPDRYIGL